MAITQERYNALFIQRKSTRIKTKLTGMAIILYMQTISGKIGRLPAKYNIKIIHRPVKKSNMLRSVKDNLECNVPDIYHIPC
jgi:hypothetical protein